MKYYENLLHQLYFKSYKKTFKVPILGQDVLILHILCYAVSNTQNLYKEVSVMEQAGALVPRNVT